jgi:hypothetical protein
MRPVTAKTTLALPTRPPDQILFRWAGRNSVIPLEDGMRVSTPLLVIYLASSSMEERVQLGLQITRPSNDLSDGPDDVRYHQAVRSGFDSRPLRFSRGSSSLVERQPTPNECQLTRPSDCSSTVGTMRGHQVESRGMPYKTETVKPGHVMCRPQRRESLVLRKILKSKQARNFRDVAQLG